MSLSTIDYADRVRSAGLNVYFVAEGAKNGHIRLERAVPANPTCNCYSIAKAFTVTAVGMLFDRGLITPETKVYDILSDKFPEGFDPRWKDVALHHVMLHQIGIDRDCADIDNETGETYPKDKDYLREILSLPIPYEVGSHHKYSDAAYYLLSRVIERVSGEDLADLMRPVLMQIMDFKEFAWSTCPLGYSMGATGLYLRTEDVVKLGILYLNGGMWNGTRVISEEWVNTVLEKGYEIKPKKNGWYGKGGMRGQMLAINPALGRAVAWHAFDSVPFDAIVRE